MLPRGAAVPRAGAELCARVTGLSSATTQHIVALFLVTRKMWQKDSKNAGVCKAWTGTAGVAVCERAEHGCRKRNARVESCANGRSVERLQGRRGRDPKTASPLLRQGVRVGLSSLA